MPADYEAEQAVLQANMEELRQIVNMDSFLKLVKKCIVSDKLFSELLHVFVEKIVVHPPLTNPATAAPSKSTFTIISLEKSAFHTLSAKKNRHDMPIAHHADSLKCEPFYAHTPKLWGFLFSLQLSTCRPYGLTFL